MEYTSLGSHVDFISAYKQASVVLDIAAKLAIANGDAATLAKIADSWIELGDSLAGYTLPLSNEQVGFTGGKNE